jgi:hypothetical protein
MTGGRDMTILYHGLGCFEDAAELEELRKQRFARIWPGEPAAGNEAER